MRLTRLALQRMLLILVMRVSACLLGTVRIMLLHMLDMLLHSLLIHALQHLQAQLHIFDKRITSRTGEILTHNHTHQFQFLAVRRHGIGGHNPSSFTEVVGYGKLVIMVLVLRVEAEGDKGEACTSFLAHNKEAELFEVGGKVVCSAGKIHHDGAVAMFAEPDHLVVLAYNLGSAF